MPGLSGSAPVYAPVADLTLYLGGTEPENAEDLLEEASAHVRHATRAAVYSTDSYLLPVDQTLRDAMHDATILQAAALAAIGWTRGTVLGSGKAPVTSKSMGGVSFTYEAGGGAEGAARRALVAGRLVEHARQYLADAGLLTTRVHAAGHTSAQRPFMRHWPWPVQIDGGEG
jgi:hypothetical protein